MNTQMHERARPPIPKRADYNLGNAVQFARDMQHLHTEVHQLRIDLNAALLELDAAKKQISVLLANS